MPVNSQQLKIPPLDLLSSLPACLTFVSCFRLPWDRFRVVKEMDMVNSYQELQCSAPTNLEVISGYLIAYRVAFNMGIASF